MIKHDEQQFTNLLLEWYDQHARVLPWREDRSAYRIWVSEIMLQQTRVEAVKPYFERFMTALPTLAAVANTSEDMLHKLWEGLGYYHRVKNMKKCASMCMELYDGELPNSAELLKTLPGIGDYTAGAIASIAYGEKISAVDGNVLRVYARVLCEEDDILKEATKKKFQRIILSYIPDDKSAQFNQALMELGALICVPNAAPRCNICPVASQCIGYHNGDAHRLPNKTKKKKRRTEQKTIVLLVCGNEVKLHKRSGQGLLADLYEFTTIDEYVLKKDIASYFPQYKIHCMTTLPKAKHIFSHVEWHMKGFLLKVDYKDEGVWSSVQDIQNTYALPTALKVYKEAIFEYIKEK